MKYRFYLDGELVAESTNILTDAGKDIILRYIAGLAPNWGGAMVIGVGTTAASVSDTKLVFETHQVETDLKVPDLTTNNVVVTATIPNSVVCSIREVGLYSVLVDQVSENPGSLITDFDTTIYDITSVTNDTTNNRIGKYAAKVDATSGNTTTAVVNDLYLSFDGYQSNDTFALAYYLADANCSNITIRFVTSTGNHYAHSFTPTAASGYYVTEFSKGSLVATGSPDWDNVVDIEISATATGGATAVSLDGLRINDIDKYADLALVSRSVLGTPITKDDTQSLNIEYEISFTL